MNREQLLRRVKEELPDHRYQHTVRVAETAVKLAKIHGVDSNRVNRVELAAILHDYCKYWDSERMKTIIKANTQLSSDLLNYDKELWHGPVGAIIAKESFGVTDSATLAAIANHTSGRPGMCLIEKVVWLADYIEPGRQFPGVEEIRALAERNLDQAMLKALANTIVFLVKREKQVYPLTLATYNELTKLCSSDDDVNR
ncbi:phosphohydrolase [Ammoniphilus oxalaticus]|uniref:bis(5'-nucleosyl)-tetraphosphatase (symmetrical) n=1 Tax=Ammoniphilus oxalaticus TaxID=66863 RepID=A0A419SJ24_9BACL|nr:bis(5'-nucleosyl)-tetraphosphatase (symmetrical) YqeK [Ammoniphilus oxalaticus]RKD23967.1 phosphohydrolase [Ammoniphilus oxalaticus]